MPKKLTDTDIWKNQRWFKKMPPRFKLAFCYLKDVCSHAGLWKIDILTLCDDLGIDALNIKDFISAVNTDYDCETGEPKVRERILLVSNNTLWFTGYLQFHWENKGGKVSPLVPAVKTALEVLSKFTLASDAKCSAKDYAIKQKFITLSEGLSRGNTNTNSNSSTTSTSDNTTSTGESEKFIYPTHDTIAPPADFYLEAIGMQQARSYSNLMPKEDVLGYWHIWKVRLNGKKHYTSIEGVYEHFMEYCAKRDISSTATKKLNVANSTNKDTIKATGKAL